MVRPVTVIAALGLGASTPVVSAEDGLDRYRWTSRLLVAVAPSPGDPRLAEQSRLFAQARREASERDLILVSASGSSRHAEALRRRFGIAPDEFRAVLVGKDGGGKLSASGPIAADRLFAEIDAMPMRREELRRRRSGGGEP